MLNCNVTGTEKDNFEEKVWKWAGELVPSGRPGKGSLREDKLSVISGRG